VGIPINQPVEPIRNQLLHDAHMQLRDKNRGRIFCCLLANKPLDAAKRNRCLQVFRDKADEEDLEQLGVQNGT